LDSFSHNQPRRLAIYLPMLHTTAEKVATLKSRGSFIWLTALSAPFRAAAPSLANVPVGMIPLAAPVKRAETETVAVFTEKPAVPATAKATLGTFDAAATAAGPASLLNASPAATLNAVPGSFLPND
jgi:hypothetical protein